MVLRQCFKPFRQLPGSILITDPLQRILYANPAALLMSGYNLKVVGKTFTLSNQGKTSENVYRDLWKTINAGEIWKGEFINQRRDGVTYRESKTIAAIYDTKGSEQYYLAIGEVIPASALSAKDRSLAGLRSINWTTESRRFLERTQYCAQQC